MPVLQWADINKELLALKKEYGLPSEIKWRYFGEHNNDRWNTLRHVTQKVRNDYREDIYKIIGSRKSLVAVSSVCKVEDAYALPYINTQADLYEYTYKPITERFQYFLQDLERTSGSQQNGMIICDHRGRDDDQRLRKAHQKFMHSSSSNTSTYDKLIETVMLTPSNMSMGVQLVDMVAGAVARSFNSNENHWLDLVKPFHRKRPNGQIEGYGLVKVPHNF